MPAQLTAGASGRARRAAPAALRFRSSSRYSGAADVRGISRRRMQAVADRVAGRPRPTVACIEWIDPLMAAGNWVPELVELAGGESLLSRAGEHSRAIPWQAVVEADPEVLVVAPCGWPLARARAEMPALAARPGFADLRATRNGRVYVADGNLYFNRSSPSLFSTIERLAEMIHPDRFGTRFDGRDYQSFRAS
jgi:iron complex transport system substrate-binding protein